jgi:hypothetical protein
VAWYLLTLWKNLFPHHASRELAVFMNNVYVNGKFKQLSGEMQ